MQKYIIVRIAPFLWMGVIFWFSAQSTLPSPNDPWLNWLIKKLAHLTEYGILYWLWVRALATFQSTSRRKYRLAMLIGVIYALSDEWHQSGVTGRHPSLTDVAIDTIGMVVVYAGFKLRSGERLKQNDTNVPEGK